MTIKKTRYDDYERTLCFDVWSGYTVHVVFTENIGMSRFARYGSYGAADNAGALHCSAERGHSHLFFKLGYPLAGTVAHECWHAVYSMMMDWAGVRDLDNETIAYHLGHLVQFVSNFWNDMMDEGIRTDGCALQQSKSLGVKSGGRKKAVHGNENS
jgi:hypothetical protein